MEHLIYNIYRLLEDSSAKQGVSWSEIVEEFSDIENNKIVEAMNSLLMPWGNVRGVDNKFWIERC